MLLKSIIFAVYLGCTGVTCQGGSIDYLSLDGDGQMSMYLDHGTYVYAPIGGYRQAPNDTIAGEVSDCSNELFKCARIDGEVFAVPRNLEGVTVWSFEGGEFSIKHVMESADGDRLFIECKPADGKVFAYIVYREQVGIELLSYLGAANERSRAYALDGALGLLR